MYGTMSQLIAYILFLLPVVQINMAQNMLTELRDSYVDCWNKIIATSSPAYDHDRYCITYWDGFMCWPAVEAGTVVALDCPHYFFGDVEGEHVYRACDDDGYWENSNVTNFKACEEAGKYDVSMEDYLQTIRIIYKIGYALSLVALTIAMGIFLYFKKLWCPRNIIHMNLFLSFMLRAVIIYIRDSFQDQSYSKAGDDLFGGGMNISVETFIYGNATIPNTTPSDVSTPGCKIVFTLTNYFTACNYFWLLVEGVYLHSLITVAVFSEKAGIKWYIALGWGFPLAFIMPWVIVQATINNEACWDAVYFSPYFWIISAPVMLSIVINFLLFLNIVRVLATKLRATNAAEAKKLRYRKLAKSTMVLIPLFGVYYMVTCGIPPQKNVEVEKFRLAWDLILASFQGFVVAILYCFMNGEVKAEISKRWHVRQLTRDINASRSYRNGHSTTFSNLTRKDSHSAMVKDSPQGSPNLSKRSEYILMMGNGNVDPNRGMTELETERNKINETQDNNCTDTNDNTPKLNRTDEKQRVHDEEKLELILDINSEETDSPRVPRGKGIIKMEAGPHQSPRRSPKLKTHFRSTDQACDCLTALADEEDVDDDDEQSSESDPTAIESVV
ncbi:vasoactive intestinal polypeptide receptor-like [Glandiceps talaboti]